MNQIIGSPAVIRSYDFDICVFIGRFQIFHNAHLHIILEALRRGKYVFILVGSANEPRRADLNPFYEQERMVMILQSIPAEFRDRIRLIPIEDSNYDTNAWVTNVKSVVADEAGKIGLINGPNSSLNNSRVTLIGHAKDHTSFYLALFPEWNTVDVMNHNGMGATAIRNLYFEHQNYLDDRRGRHGNRELALQEMGALLRKEIITKATYDFLCSFSETDDYASLVDDLLFNTNYKKQFEGERWPRNHVTADMILTQGTKILLIKRKARPGMGLWALPGGFVNPDETIWNGAIREGYEETKMKLPKAIFLDAFVKQDYFDAPNRDPRGRFVTHAFHFHLHPKAPKYDEKLSLEENQKRVRAALALPWVRGSDDAQNAKWFERSELSRSEMFLDHFSIIAKMTKDMPKDI